MKEKYKSILFQAWMFECLDSMSTEEQDKYLLALIKSAVAGKAISDNPKWRISIRKSLLAIEHTRDKENGMKGKEFGILGKEYGILGKEFGIQGKEYGIQGKEFGILGGRPRKGESPEEYAKRKMPLRLKMGKEPK